MNDPLRRKLVHTAVKKNDTRILIMLLFFFFFGFRNALPQNITTSYQTVIVTTPVRTEAALHTCYQEKML